MARLAAVRVTGRLARAGLAAGLLALAAGVLVWGAERLPLLDRLVFGYDWHNYWVMFQGGWPDYAAVDVFNPPWTLLLLLPLGALSFKAGWALLTLLNLIVLLVSVPPRAAGRPDLPAIAALLFAFWTLRHLADGNLAVFMVGGFLLLDAGWRRGSPWLLAAGLVLATAKPQESALALVALGIMLVRDWPPRRWALAGGLALAGMLPALALLGAGWLARLLPGAELAPSVARLETNISLAALTAAGAPGWARPLAGAAVLAGSTGVIVRRWRDLAFTRPLAGLLIAAALLLSPYANGASLAVLLAVGVVPLLRERPALGWALLALAYLPYLTLVPNTASGWPEAWQMLYVAGLWAALGWHVAATPLRDARPAEAGR